MLLFVLLGSTSLLSKPTINLETIQFGERIILKSVVADDDFQLKEIDVENTYKISSVDKLTPSFPLDFALDQNYPNPFNPITTITFSVPIKSNVSLEIYNLIGQKIMTLVQGEVEAGKHSVQLNGSSMSSGIYLFKLTAVGENGSQFTSSKKMTLLK